MEEQRAAKPRTLPDDEMGRQIEAAINQLMVACNARASATAARCKQRLIDAIVSNDEATWSHGHERGYWEAQAHAEGEC